LITSVARSMPTEAIRLAVTTATVTTATLATATFATATFATADAAADAATLAAADAATLAAADAATLAAFATADAATFAATTTFWNNLRTDCQALLQGDSGGDLLNEAVLWAGDDNPWHDRWQQVKQTAVGPEWQFWIDWYQDELAGKPPKNRKMLHEIAALSQGDEIYPISDADWQQGPKHIAAMIADIEKKHRKSGSKSGGTSGGGDITKLLGATLYDFNYDQLASIMRAIPMPDDWKHLQEPETLQRFLRDAQDVREGFELLNASFAAEGRAMQGAGRVQVYLNSVLAELANAEQVGSLRVGALLERGRSLEGICNDTMLRAEFGSSLSEQLQRDVQNLRDLLRKHFANTLARFSVLRDVHLEDDADLWQVLQEFRDIVALVGDGAKGEIPALDTADVAVLQDMLDSIDGLARAIDGAQTDDAKASLRRDYNFQLAKVGATVEVYKEKAAKAVGKGGDVSDATLKWWKRGKGLAGLAKALKDGFEYLSNGGG